MSPLRLLAFIARRLLVMAALLLVLSFAIFSLLSLSPGSPERSLLGTRPATPQNLEAIRHEYHLDKPFLEQYWLWLKGAVHLDFGNSIQTQQPVSDLISQRMSVSIRLLALAFGITAVLGVLSGVIAAVRERTPVDRAIVAGTIVGVSAPAFVTGIILLYVFSVELGWFPVAGGGGDSLNDYILPAIALAVSVMALLTRITRAAMQRELARDHITFARARGLSQTRVLLVHGVRNALIPIVTSAGLIVSLMFGGSVLIETVFSLNGAGSLLISSTTTQDFPVVQALALLIATTIIVINLLVDLSYLVLDPRVRFERARA